jgi:hypothetical protein
MKIFWLIAGLCLCGCALVGNPKQHSWRTVASRDGEREVLEHIRFLEDANGRKGCPLNVMRVDDKGEELAARVEFWTIESCGTETVYKIRTAPLGPGQSKISVSYPRAADLYPANP